MPSAEQLTLYQAQRRSMLVNALAAAGWRPDHEAWDAGAASDVIASMTLPGPDGLLRCDYVIAGAGVGDDPREYLSLHGQTAAGQTSTMVIDFLGQTRTGPDRLTDVLGVLVAVRPGPVGYLLDVDTLTRLCPVFTVDGQGVRTPLTSPADPGVDPAGGDPGDVGYADEVEDRLHRDLVPAGWRRSPSEAILHGALETFFVDTGQVRLSVGRCNGEETLVRLTAGEASTHLRIDGVRRPEHADRLIALLRHWQDRLTGDSCPRLVADVVASYAAVYLEDGPGAWRRLRADTPPGPALPPPGGPDRARAVAARLSQAGWTPVAGPDGTPRSLSARSRVGASIRVEHVQDGLDGLPEALVVSVRLAEGTAGRFGTAVALALDVLDLHSARGGVDLTHDALSVILARYTDLDADTLPTLVRALQLCCPVFLVDSEGALQPLRHDVAEVTPPELVLPAPRPVCEIDRLRAAGAAGTAELWFERGLAALAEDRPDLALGSFDAAIRVDPDFGPAHLHRALLVEPIDVAEAARGLLRCAELGYALSLVLARYGRLLLRHGHPEDGLAVFRRLTEQVPEYGSGWYERSQAALRQGLYDESVAAATAAVHRTPDHAGAYVLRARGYARSGQPERALADVARALDLDGSLRADVAADQDLGSLRGDDRFAAVLDPWSTPGDTDLPLPATLVAVLRRSGWQPVTADPGPDTALTLPSRAGRLTVGAVGEAVYLTLEPTGQDAGTPWWLYASQVDDPAELAALVVAWQDRLDVETFAEFATQVRAAVPHATWRQD